MVLFLLFSSTGVSLVAVISAAGVFWSRCGVFWWWRFGGGAFCWWFLGVGCSAGGTLVVLFSAGRAFVVVFLGWCSGGVLFVVFWLGCLTLVIQSVIVSVLPLVIPFLMIHLLCNYPFGIPFVHPLLGFLLLHSSLSPHLWDNFSMWGCPLRKLWSQALGFIDVAPAMAELPATSGILVCCNGFYRIRSLLLSSIGPVKGWDGCVQWAMAYSHCVLDNESHCVQDAAVGIPTWNQSLRFKHPMFPTYQAHTRNISTNTLAICHRVNTKSPKTQQLLPATAFLKAHVQHNKLMRGWY